MIEKFIIPFSGKLLSLEQVPDVNFSQKRLGEGFAIKFDDNKVISPFTGVVIAAFPTGHAFIIRRKDGLEVLIHLGLNSANKPEAFQMQVEKYQTVKQGDVLVRVNKDLLASQSDMDLISPIVFGNPNINVQLHKLNQNLTLGDEQAVSFDIN